VRCIYVCSKEIRNFWEHYLNLYIERACIAHGLGTVPMAHGNHRSKTMNLGGIGKLCGEASLRISSDWSRLYQ
jgi:hypothetical protein